MLDGALLPRLLRVAARTTTARLFVVVGGGVVVGEGWCRDSVVR